MSGIPGYRKGNRFFVHGEIAYILPNNSAQLILIDTNSISKIEDYTWCVDAMGYASARKKKGRTLLHQLLLDTPKGFDTDHINGNRQDNRVANLRITTRNVNCINSYRTGKSGHRHIGKRTNTYQVQIWDKGRFVYSKYFKTLNEAISARNTELTKLGREIPYYGLETLIV